MRITTCFFVIVAVLGLIGPSTANADILQEDFNGGIPPGRWNVINIGAAGAPWSVYAPDEAGRLRISKAADDDSSTAATNLSGGITSSFYLDGNLSVFVDFQLLDFPLADGEGWNEAAIRLTGHNSGVAFYSLRFASNTSQRAEGFSSLPPYVLGFVEDNTTAGRLGITREGSTMKAWIDRGSGPVLLGSLTSPDLLGPMDVAIYAAQAVNYDVSPAARPHTALDVRFDNVDITADSIIPEPATLSLLVLGGLAMLRRR